jgi:hypothetical protein
MTVLVTAVGSASGARAAAAALACAGSDAERAGLLIDVDASRLPRASLIATAAARALEERLTAHLPDAAVASRGRICQLAFSTGEDGWVEQATAALPLARGSTVVIHLPPTRFQEALSEPRLEPCGALLRADLPGDRALTALAVAHLMQRRLEVVVLKRSPAWLPARAAMLGALPDGGAVLPAGAGRLLR